MEVPVSEARDRFSELVNEVAFGKKRCIVNRRGKQVVAIISIEDLQALEAQAPSGPESNKTIKEASQ